MTVCYIPQDCREHVDEICAEYDSLEDIMEACSDLACNMLSFASTNDIQHGKANCIGYAQLTSAIINYSFKVKKFPYHAKPVVGKVYLFGIDLNNVAQKILPQKHRLFFKDHDFVEINLGDKVYYLDTSLQDFTGFSFIQTELP